MPGRRPPAAGEAGGFNGVQKLFTTASATALFACGRVTGIEPSLSSVHFNRVGRGSGRQPTSSRKVLANDWSLLIVVRAAAS